jgi:hypothetical protein
MEIPIPERLNKAIDDVVRSGSGLIQAAKAVHGDPDDISRESIRSAMSAFENFSSVWKKIETKSEDQLLRGNRVFDVAQQLKDDPSVQTALGSYLRDFFRILELVQQATRPEESKRVKGTSFDSLGKK